MAEHYCEACGSQLFPCMQCGKLVPVPASSMATVSNWQDGRYLHIGGYHFCSQACRNQYTAVTTVTAQEASE